jgi:hypothetical protein
MEGVNYLGYGFVLKRRGFSRMRQASGRLTQLFQRSPFLFCLLVAGTPLPDWSARVLGALARYSPLRYLLAFGLGRVPKFWVIAALGHELRVPRPMLIAVVIGSLALTLVGRFGGGAVAGIRASLRSTGPVGSGAK